MDCTARSFYWSKLRLAVNLFAYPFFMSNRNRVPRAPQHEQVYVETISIVIVSYFLQFSSNVTFKVSSGMENALYGFLFSVSCFYSVLGETSLYTLLVLFVLFSYFCHTCSHLRLIQGLLLQFWLGRSWISPFFSFWIVLKVGDFHLPQLPPPYMGTGFRSNL